MFISVDWIREPDRAVRMDNDIIRGVEWARMIIIEEGGGFVGPFGFHIYKARWFAK